MGSVSRDTVKFWRIMERARRTGDAGILKEIDRLWVENRIRHRQYIEALALRDHLQGLIKRRGKI